MPKPSHRDKILTEGLQLVHRRGFAGASVRDIVQAAGVPQGSFTNHFASKEAFGLEILEIYFERHRKLMNETLLNEELPPLQRLSGFIDANKNRGAQFEMRKGCLFGNFSAEASEHSEAIRIRLVEVFAEIQQLIASCLQAAVKTGELEATIDCDEVAGFIVSSLQGATLLAKAQRSPIPVERFKKVLFSTVLGSCSTAPLTTL